MGELTGGWSSYDEHPKYVLSDGDEPVSRAVIVEKLIRIGEAEVRSAGLAGVWTDPERRKEGLASRCLNEALAHVTAEGRCPISLLFGIGDFYQRFGYATLAGEPTFCVPTESLPDDGQPGRSLADGDRPALERLYRNHALTRTGSVIRPAGWSGPFGGPGWSRGATVRILEDEGEAVGYVVYDADPQRGFAVSEAVATGPEQYYRLAGMIRRAAWQAPDVTFHCAQDDPLAIHLQRYGGTWRERVPLRGGLMGRILLMQPFLEALVPTFCRRLGAASPRWHQNLLLSCELGDYTIAVHKREAAIEAGHRREGLRVDLPQHRLLQLAFGFRPVWDLLDEPGVRLQEPAVEILSALFPPGRAYLWWTDRF